MGKGCLREDHPLLLGMTGFWGTPIANESCRTADLIVAIGTRLAEANSSSWDSRFTFDIPPTRLIHIDIDPAEIARNYATELGVVAESRRSPATDRRRPRRVRLQLGRSVEFEPVPDAAGANSERTQEGDSRGRV